MDDLNFDNLSTEDLIKKVDELFFEDKIEEVYEELTIKLLEQHGNLVLYAYHFLTCIEWEGNVDVASMEEYSNLEGILDWQREVLLAFIDMENQNNINAIAHFDKCYEIRREFKFVYYKGRSLFLNKNFKESIEIFDECINEGKISDAFFYRGKAHYLLENTEKAIEDFEAFRDKNPYTSEAYLHLGFSYGKVDNLPKAIDNYDKAIRISPDWTVVYLAKARLFDNNNNLKEAYDVLQQAEERSLLKGKDKVYLKLTGHILANNVILDRPVSSVVDFYVGILSVMRQFSIDNDGGTKFIAIVIEKIIPSITRLRKLSEDTENLWSRTNNHSDDSVRFVSHYTNLKVADKLIMNPDSKEGGEKLRYNNTTFLNDPEEGRVLFDYFKNSGIGTPDEWEEIFSLLETKVISNSNFFIGSFLPVDDIHEDDLVMWRTYGKDHLNNEAAGCSLLIDTKFFDRHSKSFIPIQTSNRKRRKKEPKHEFSNFSYQPLYRVFYYNRLNKSFINLSNIDIASEAFPKDVEELRLKDEAIKKCLEEIGQAILELKGVDILDTRKNESSKEMNHFVINHVISELRFLFKSADYSYENELRVIINGDAESVIISREDSLPRRTYIESKKAVTPYLKKIILGPKVPHPDRWIYLDTKMSEDYPDNSFELIKSKCNFQ